jgi:hypothetical protein
MKSYEVSKTFLHTSHIYLQSILLGQVSAGHKDQDSTMRWQNNIHTTVQSSSQFKPSIQVKEPYSS